MIKSKLKEKVKANLNIKGKPLKLKHASQCLGVVEAHSQRVLSAVENQRLVNFAQFIQPSFALLVDRKAGVLQVVLDV